MKTNLHQKCGRTQYSKPVDTSEMHPARLSENFTTTAAGRMMMQMVGAFAEFERAMIRERTRAGLDAARSEGRVGGRRPRLRADQRCDIAENILSGRRTGAQMARLYGVSPATISRIVNSCQAAQPKDENMLQIRPLLPAIPHTVRPPERPVCQPSPARQGKKGAAATGQRPGLLASLRGVIAAGRQFICADCEKTHSQGDTFLFN